MANVVGLGGALLRLRGGVLKGGEPLLKRDNLVVVRSQEAAEMVEQAFDAQASDGGSVQVVEDSCGHHVSSRPRLIEDGYSQKGVYPDRYRENGKRGWAEAGNACPGLGVKANMAYEIGGTGRGSLQGQNEGSVEFDDSSQVGSVENRLSTVRTLVEDIVHAGESRFMQDVKVDGKIWRVSVEPVVGL